ncbi:Hypothetical predicted protein [Mytilus galloprovincialis]|uniref:Uncharacterized protein n=1 Tax=Mytilus galloprovincialis TaxID=29158 RepID=A0A8B6HB44_MYTGA|nr:Hypothetical predicted protein [Mytilus galloprovincialis]
MSILIVILVLSLVQANHNIFDVNSRCTKLGRSSIYKCSEFSSGVYDIISEDASRVIFKRFQNNLVIHIAQDQNTNLQRIDAQHGVCPTVVANVVGLVVKVNTQDCGEEIVFTTENTKTTDRTTVHPPHKPIDACTNCPNQEEIIWGQLSTNIQIIIYAAIVCAPLSVIVLTISCCLKSTKGRRYLLNCPRALCREEQEVTPLETPMQGFGLFTKACCQQTTFTSSDYSTTSLTTTACQPTAGSSTTRSTTTTHSTTTKEAKPKTPLQS